MFSDDFTLRYICDDMRRIFPRPGRWGKYAKLWAFAEKEYAQQNRANSGFRLDMRDIVLTCANLCEFGSGRPN